MDSLDGFDAPLESLGLVQGANEVITVSASTPALEVFAKMRHEKLSGVGVVDGGKQEQKHGEDVEAGRLLANLSASDVRGLTQELFGSLALPLGAFLLLMHPRSSPISGTASGSLTWEDALLDQFPSAVKEQRWAEAMRGLPPLVTCTPTSTLREVLEMLVQRGKHRVYVCDEKGRAVGVVTPTDVLRAIITKRD